MAPRRPYRGGARRGDARRIMQHRGHKKAVVAGAHRTHSAVEIQPAKSNRGRLTRRSAAYGREGSDLVRITRTQHNAQKPRTSSRFPCDTRTEMVGTETNPCR